MNTITPLKILLRLLLAGLILLNLAAKTRGETYNIGNVTYSRDAAPREFTASYLAKRLGIAQRSSTLRGIAVKERNGHKVGRLQDVVVDWSSGKVLCALVEVDGKVVAVPGRTFFSTDERQALLEANTAKLDAAPTVTTEDLPKLAGSLGPSYEYFGQKTFWDPAVAPAQACKCSDLVGLNVRNAAGESLGQVVNLMVDLPTARVVFAVASFSGVTSGSDLYIAPPTAFQRSADGGLVANIEKAKVAEQAHSDGFFWSNMADPNWGIIAYRAFGKQADFDVSAPAAAAPVQQAAGEPVREKVSAPPVATTPVKGDRELTQDILTALMRDNVDNPFIFSKVKILPSNGQVTLSGQVKNEKLKAKLVSIVASVVGEANVHDQVTVK